MLRGLLICPDADLSAALAPALAETNQVGLARDVDRYPDAFELMRVVLAYAPHVVFISTESVAKFYDLVKILEKEAAGVQVVAVSRSCDQQLLLEVMRAGVREFLSAPFQREVVFQALARVEDLVEKNPPSLAISDQLYSFIPAKQGVGASTVALNTALALARQKDAKNLMIDMDLTSGIIGFLLKANPVFTVLHAAENSHNLDESLWPQMVMHRDGLDLLLTGGLNPEFRIDMVQVRHILDYARRRYAAICVDLSGNLERYSIEIMHESKRIFVVVTPEIPSLHLAREKLKFLKNVELHDRVSVVLNRNHRRAVISPDQVENLLGVPLMTTLSNDYQGVHRALQEGRAVDPQSELGRQFSALAANILDRQAAREPHKRRLVDYLSILPGHYSMARD